ncbi:MAG TPA: hypothetical protein VH637_17420 [Streptosporangiaceae bacterium]|jgi:hypothetical protein
MAFVQIIEFSTHDIEGMRQVDDEWERATEGRRTARRQLVAADRDHPGKYYTIVFFDSYESAMENSGLPETKAAADRYMALTDGTPVFRNLDVLAEKS